MISAQRSTSSSLKGSRCIVRSTRTTWSSKAVVSKLKPLVATEIISGTGSSTFSTCNVHAPAQAMPEWTPCQLPSGGTLGSCSANGRSAWILTPPSLICHPCRPKLMMMCTFEAATAGSRDMCHVWSSWAVKVMTCPPVWCTK
eukprot:Skav220904  [mRNA]  locus=scaffold3880:255321:275677:- [translate_table: standard]